MTSVAENNLVLLVQLPIPPPGPGPVEGNVPLAAAYLKLFARRQGLEEFYDIQLLPPSLTDNLGDQGLVEEILARRPWMVGFTCYLWNVERSLWVAGRLKQHRPELKVLLGGPEITADNTWVLQNPAVDYAIFGEGEASFAELLAAPRSPHPRPLSHWERGEAWVHPQPRPPLANLDATSSPYVEGILEITEGGRMLLETVRGCRFQCKYCHYPKGQNVPRLLSDEQILANLRHAVERGPAEVVLLDPTLNQRPDFKNFLRLLARGNAGGQLAFSGELRAEGIDAEAARLLREANFHEVEIGLQSVEPRAWQLMGRPTDLAAFERGVKLLLAEGIKVQVDLILGLPGDTVDSVRRGFDFLHRTGAYSEVQVFNLSILPGTAFRREIQQLGLQYQPWPPYYVLKTPTLDMEQMLELMEEAQAAFATEFDSLPPPQITFDNDQRQTSTVRFVDLGEGNGNDESSRGLTAPGQIVTEHEWPHRGLLAPGYSTEVDFPALAFTLWIRSANFDRQQRQAAEQVQQLLADNPHTTLQVVLEPTGDPERLTIETLQLLLAACYQTTTYLDRYYSLHPGRLLGSKRLTVLLAADWQSRVNRSWREAVAEYAMFVWRDR